MCGDRQRRHPESSLFCLFVLSQFSFLLATFCLARQIMRSGSSGTVSPNVPIAYYLNYQPHHIPIESKFAWLAQ